MKLIDKAAVVAEIERRIATYKNITGADRRTDALISLKNFLNTLEVIEVGVDFGDSEGDKSTFEVKEVDLEEACEQLAENARKHKAETSSPFFSQTDYKQGVMDGAKWQKEHHQAEKDLALTLEDIKAIDELILYVDRKYSLDDDVFYQEVLNRYNKYKEDGRIWRLTLLT